MTSSPLFTSVALSTVIFLPILHVGCARTSLTVTLRRSSNVLPLKGPPEAVSRSFLIERESSPCRHWKKAPCSLSTGRIFTPRALARLVMSSPATTRVSLLASAIFFPLLMALIVGSKPAKPLIAVKTTSTPSKPAASMKACRPPATSTP